ncbi:hypothetical protein V1477_020765, partial [Vespula maculifrons]
MGESWECEKTKGSPIAHLFTGLDRHQAIFIGSSQDVGQADGSTWNSLTAWTVRKNRMVLRSSEDEEKRKENELEASRIRIPVVWPRYLWQQLSRVKTNVKRDLIDPIELNGRIRLLLKWNVMLDTPMR